MDYFVAIVTVVAVIGIIFTKLNESKKRQLADDAFQKHLASTGFTVSKRILLPNGFEMLIDDGSKRWCIRHPVHVNHPNVYTYTDLIGYEVFEDEQSITQSTTTGVIEGRTGSAIVGGMLFGATGAVIGSAGKRGTRTTTITTSADVCNSLYVLIRVNDFQAPEMFVPILTKATAKSNALYTQCAEAVRVLVTHLAYMQEQKEENMGAPAALTGEADSTETYAEIERLHELLQKGIVTQDEFNAKKKQLLNL